MRKCAVIGAVVSVGSLWSGVSSAAVLSPVADNFVYQGLPSLNMINVGIGDILATGRSGSGHTTQTYLRFDVSAVTLNPGDTAKLRLYVRDNTPAPGSGAPQFGVAPTPAFPLTAEVSNVGAAWSQATVTWLSRPSASGSVLATTSITGINQYFEWDLTSAVAGWLANPSSNLGVLVSSPSTVTPQQGQTVYAIFNSTRNTEGNAPQLVITAIPEPSSIGLLAGTLPLVMRRRRA